jgi:riboflavin-specific deaminase-like protein
VTRPTVILNMAVTADGKIAPVVAERARLGSAVDRREMDRLRAGVDAVIVGAGTVRAVDPPLHVRDASLAATRPAPALQVVVSGSGRVSPLARALCEPAHAPRILATTGAATVDPTLEQRGVEVWRFAETPIRIDELCQRLAERGVGRLLLEGGAELNAAFVAAKAVDELYLTITPLILGGRQAPTLVGGAGATLAAATALELVETRALGAEIFCHYRVRHDRGP